MRLLLGMISLISLPLFAQVPMIKAQVETDPIPAGTSDSDDPAIWRNAKDPARSLILGTSKYDENGLGGLGVYDLQGKQLNFFAGSKLNSVDVVDGLAVASNRSEQALDFYRISKKGEVSYAGRSLLPSEPYGLCLTPDNKVYLPTKSGVLYAYEIDEDLSLELTDTIDLKSFVTAKQDAFIKSIVTKEAVAEGEEDKLEKHLAERFILENCVYDEKSQKLYVGMENLGIWEIDTDSKKAPTLAIPVQGSWTDIDSWGQDGRPRVTDDIEGLDILRVKDRTLLLFSSQGISEFTLYDLKDKRWLGNFQITFDSSDPITFTDGLAVMSGNFGPRYPEGLLVVHDDENTEADGSVAPGNYKVVSLADLWRALPIRDDKD